VACPGILSRGCRPHAIEDKIDEDIHAQGTGANDFSGPRLHEKPVIWMTDHA
jgi:hypothetical protein